MTKLIEEIKEEKVVGITNLGDVVEKDPIAVKLNEVIRAVNNLTNKEDVQNEIEEQWECSGMRIS